MSYYFEFSCRMFVLVLNTIGEFKQIWWNLKVIQQQRYYLLQHPRSLSCHCCICRRVYHLLLSGHGWSMWASTEDMVCSVSPQGHSALVMDPHLCSFVSSFAHSCSIQGCPVFSGGSCTTQPWQGLIPWASVAVLPLFQSIHRGQCLPQLSITNEAFASS